MKRILIVLSLSIALAACSSKKTESTQVLDSLHRDSLSMVGSVQAEVPATASLAYSLMPGYTAKNTVALTDTVNFILLPSQSDIDKNFVFDKTAAGILQPDFIINHIVGIVCLPRMTMTTITLDKVEVGESAINVYVNITNGEALKIATKPAQLFAIEKRDGVGNVQFFVNGKMDKAFFLAGLP